MQIYNKCFPVTPAAARYINNGLHLARKYARTFDRGYYLFKEANSFRERSSRRTVNFEEQIMSKDKYPSTYFCVYYPSNIFRYTDSLKNRRIFSEIPQSGNIRSRDVFRPFARKRKYLMSNIWSR